MQKFPRKSLLRALCFAVCFSLLPVVVLLSLIALPLDPAPYLGNAPSPVMLDRHGRVLNVFLNQEEHWCFPREANEVSHHLRNATIAVEDQRFFSHPGVDPVAVLRAAWQNVGERRTVSGASTLTMQVVKMREGAAPGLTAKIWQAINALRLDARAEKESILAAYLNNAPYGRNMLGVEAAAQRFFTKPASELLLAEAALLAGLPQSPTLYDPLRFPERAQARRNHVLSRMHAEGYITSAQMQDAMGLPVSAGWNELPQAAPHLAMQMREEIKESLQLSTTLDLDLQTQAQGMLKKHLNRFPREVGNGALIVLHLPSNEVRARVGSADFFDAKDGQVDLCRAPRSPGSTLKPFTYALAMQQQKLYPTEVLLDDNLDFGTYNPANFDGGHNGLVTATEALRFSLNVPAIMALQRVELGDYWDFLRELGFASLDKSPEHYGLGITLGNCEASLEELVAAYAMLANRGVYSPLRILKDEPQTGASNSLSPGVAETVSNMLRQPFPHDWITGLLSPNESSLRQVSWKTGTSTDFKDAWAIAFEGEWLVGVWMGNNDGRASRQLVGAWAALPLAGDLIRSLIRQEPIYHQSKIIQTDIKKVNARLCSDTGLPANEHCPQVLTRSISNDMYLHRRCGVHLKTWEGHIKEIWPASPHAWDLARQKTNIFANKTTLTNKNRRIKIVSPPESANFVLSGEKNGDQIQLLSTQDNSEKMHWYLDEQYLGASLPDMPLYWRLLPGKHTVSCMSESGVVDSVRFEVSLPERGIELFL